VGQLLFLVLAYLLAANVLATYLLTLASIWNYPGGQALSRFNELYAGEKHG
jgi:alpha-1,6-mannosyltransferase